MPRSAETTCSAHSRIDQRSDEGFSRASSSLTPATAFRKSSRVRSRTESIIWQSCSSITRKNSTAAGGIARERKFRLGLQASQCRKMSACGKPEIKWINAHASARYGIVSWHPVEVSQHISHRLLEG